MNIFERISVAALFVANVILIIITLVYGKRCEKVAPVPCPQPVQGARHLRDAPPYPPAPAPATPPAAPAPPKSAKADKLAEVHKAFVERPVQFSLRDGSLRDFNFRKPVAVDPDQVVPTKTTAQLRALSTDARTARDNTAHFL